MAARTHRAASARGTSTARNEDVKMRAMQIAFEVEQAGCESCGRLVTAALTPYGTVKSLVIDEQADIAAVVLAVSDEPKQGLIDEGLANASGAAGHRYRVRAGSWRIL